MNYFLLFIVAVVFFGLKISSCFSTQHYLTKESTSCINGIFVLFVFISHFSSYTDQVPFLDSQMRSTCIWLGQLMVAPFLFFSGYGIMESIKKKGERYINGLPPRRILPTWLNFALAVCLFIIVNVCLGYDLSLKKVALSLLGWDSIGNSNWYIFAIIYLYFISFISFKAFKIPGLSIASVWIASIAYFFFMSFLKPAHWYNTALCYALGMSFSHYQPKLEHLLQSQKKWTLSLVFTILAFLTFKHCSNNQLLFQLSALLFCLIIALVLARVTINNAMLRWLGSRVFWIYILQRIPMMIFSRFYIVHSRQLVYLAITFLVTLALAELAHQITASAKKILTR